MVVTKLKTVRPAPTNRYEDRGNWRLVCKKRLLELKPGFVVETHAGKRVIITGLQPPHKYTPMGRVSVTQAGGRGSSTQYYPSVIDAEYQYTGELS